MPMVLVPLDGGRPVPLDKAIVFFGRGPDCDVVLNTSRKVSRKHCCIAQIDDYFVARDLGSMNGLRVNDRVVKNEVRLNVGDEIWVGDLGFRLQALNSVVDTGKPADARSEKKGEKKRKPKPPPQYPSEDIPIAIPEEGVDFRVEQSIPQKIIPDDDVLSLEPDDFSGDDDA